MTDTTETSQKTEVRRAPKIVLDRPPFSLSRFLIFTALGLIGGLLLGWILSVLQFEDRWSRAFHFPNEHYPYLVPLTVFGLFVGALIGWSIKREVTARHEMVEFVPTTPSRRRVRRRTTTSTTTEIVRY